MSAIVTRLRPDREPPGPPEPPAAPSPETLAIPHELKAPLLALNSANARLQQVFGGLFVTAANAERVPTMLSEMEAQIAALRVLL